MGSIAIRKAELLDCQMLATLMQHSAMEQQMNTDAFLTPEDLRRDGFKDWPVLTIFVGVAKNGEISGYLLSYYWYSTTSGFSCFIEDIYVEPTQRRKGIGSALWKTFVKEALSQKCCRCEARSKAPGKFLLSLGMVDLHLSAGDLVFMMDEKSMGHFVQENQSIDGIEIRKACRSDISALEDALRNLNVDLDIGAMEIDAADLQKYGYGEQPIFLPYVAVRDTVIVGYTIFFFIYNLDGYGIYMEDLFVYKDFRKKGIGMALWRLVIKKGLEFGCKRCIFSVDEKNIQAIQFYKSRGAIDLTATSNIHFFSMKREAMERIAVD